MAPDGTLLTEEITVQGTQRRSDGSVQTDLAALDVDPDDPAYLWVTDAFSPTNTNHYLVYQVRISDGQVVHGCHIIYPRRAVGGGIQWGVGRHQTGGGNGVPRCPQL